jgi:hypothetical protein
LLWLVWSELARPVLVASLAYGSGHDPAQAMAIGGWMRLGLAPTLVAALLITVSGLDQPLCRRLQSIIIPG